MKVDFLLGIVLVFVPIDIILELSGDVGVLLFTGLMFGILIWLRQRSKRSTTQIAGIKVLPGPESERSGTCLNTQNGTVPVGPRL